MTVKTITLTIVVGIHLIVACSASGHLTIKNQKAMFTAQDLQKAHSKVKTGADFPAYIREIKAMGVTHYETYVTDGHIDYHGANGQTAKVPAKYTPIPVADVTDTAKFIKDLKAHQDGKTDFLAFIRMCADTGIEKWEICMDKMTCTYYDQEGNEVLVENIPQ